MALPFEWDPAKAAASLSKHGVSFEEAATVSCDPLGKVVDDPRHSAGEQRSVPLGHFDRQRLVVVVFTERGEAIRLISARRATNWERREYEEG